MKREKFKEQEQEYVFPYHYIPYYDEKGNFHRIRRMASGFEYLGYMKHIGEELEKYHVKSVIDIGCGDGRFFSLTKKEYKYKAGYDLAEQAIQFAKAFNPNVIYKCENIENIDSKVDAMVCIEVLEHIPDEVVDIFLESIFEKLEKNGLLFIQVPTKVQPLISKHYRHYDEDLLTEQLKKAYSNIDILSTQYLYYDTWLSKIYSKYTCNRKITLLIQPLEQLFWRYSWNKLRFANKKNGKHLLFIVKKNG